MVVSMRPIRREQVVRAIQVTSRFPATHGARCTSATPRSSESTALDEVDFETGRVEIGPDEVPLFWGCGCTPQAAAMKAGLDFMITHKAGHLFITDTLSEEIAAL